MNKPQNTISRDRDTGLAFVLLMLILMYWLDNLNLVLPTIGILVVAILWPGTFRPLSRIWLAFGEAVGTVGSTVILSLLYFALVYPIGKLRQLTGSDPMRLSRWKKNDGSVFHDRGITYQQKDLEKPY